MSEKVVEEGEVRLEVPEGRIYDQNVFYNPEMELDRNISVCAASLEEPDKLCDALSASGVRGIRYKREGGVGDVWLNDASPDAVERIRKNCEINNVECNVTNKDAGVLLRQNMFDYIDIDPFGSPVPFFDSVGKSIRDDGFLSITATDTSSFFGTYPRVSRRRYGRKSMKVDYNKELGLRILISALMDSLGRYKKTFVPRLSYFHEHYAKIYGNVVKGAKEVQRNFRKFGYISHCFDCGWRNDSLNKECPLCGSETEQVNVYLGSINTDRFCENLASRLRERDFYDEASMVSGIHRGENIPYHYDIHYLAKKMNLETLPTDKLIEMLEEEGYEARESEFSPTAVKSGAPFEVVKRLLQSRSR
ncbi:MAG: hypothetical protein ABEJ72_04605 [Candidatus Aenigmatarchaeota archaeon]